LPLVTVMWQVHSAICWKTRVSVRYSPHSSCMDRESPGSDNSDGAENQQERLIRTGWVVGFVDGEGCFSIGFVRQPNRLNRKGYRTGYQVSHEFAVTQGEQSIECLNELRDFFGVGQVLINKRYDNHREHLHRYVVRSRNDLLEKIIPFFRRYPMRSSKQVNFEKFASCVELIEANRHLSPHGLIEIAQIAETMNRRKSRHDLIRILRGHTPNTPDTG
jgi:LAGLIDADG endonuclease